MNNFQFFVTPLTKLLPKVVSHSSDHKGTLLCVDTASTDLDILGRALRVDGVVVYNIGDELDPTEISAEQRHGTLLISIPRKAARKIEVKKA